MEGINKRLMDNHDFPKVSVIVLNWNGRKYIRECLDSLLGSKYPKNRLEIIVVDNASSDESREIIEREYPEVTLIKNKENVGFCEGNNIGIKRATGDIIILLNNDTVVDENWICKILEEAKDTKVGVIGCKLLYPSGNIIQSLGCKEKFLGYWKHIGAGHSVEELSHEGELEVDYVPGAALAIKREVVEKIGLLDSRFYAYVEEVDWCYRAKKAGYKVVVSDAVVYHYESASWRRFPLKRLYLTYRNKILFISKHYPKMMLLKYFLEYPIRFTVESLLNFLRKDTVTQRISFRTSNKNVLRRLLKIFTLNIFSFYLTIIPGLMLVHKLLGTERLAFTKGIV